MNKTTDTEIIEKGVAVLFSVLGIKDTIRFVALCDGGSIDSDYRKMLESMIRDQKENHE